jgi:hypothetical protein
MKEIKAAKNNRKFVIGKMTSSEIKQANELVRNWDFKKESEEIKDGK